MILFVDICQLSWMPVFLSWLLPFLLGLGLGRMIWGPYKLRSEDQEKELVKYKGRISELDADYQSCQKARTQLEAESAELRGKVRELERGIQKGSVSRVIPEVKDQQQIEQQAPQEESPATIDKAQFGSLSDRNLQIIEGIGDKIEKILNGRGIHSWTDLAAMNEVELADILVAEDPKLRIIDTSSWPAQAAMAEKREWRGLIEFQKSFSNPSKSIDASARMSKVERFMKDAGIMNRYNIDDLKAIEGIGPKVEKLLKENGIEGWESLSNTTVDKLQEILDSAGDRFKLANPMTWPTQATLAYNREWNELKKLQDRLIGGV